LIGKAIRSKISEVAKALMTLLQRNDRDFDKSVSKMIKAEYKKVDEIVELLDRYKGDVEVMQSVCAAIDFPNSQPFQKIDQKLLQADCFKTKKAFQEHLAKIVKSASDKSRLLPRVCRLCCRVSTALFLPDTFCTWDRRSFSISFNRSMGLREFLLAGIS
jgi:hypothetical protein